MNAKIDRLVSYYFRHLTPADSSAPSARFSSVAEWIFNTVEGGLVSEGPEIRYLLNVTLLRFGEDVARAAVELGHLRERKTNPALRAFGESVAHACKISAKRDREIARDVFEKLTEQGSNSAYAFYQAIDAIGGRPPEGT